jgi:predicted  nucleic acid-binding Zn-ribbon protein
MDPVLEKLIRLQRAESDWRRADTARAEIPSRKAITEAELARERSQLESARASLEASTKARRKAEGELQDLEGKRSRYRAQLMEVKTNKEYTAMLHEIEGVEREIRTREDHILEEMERSEGLAAEVTKEEQAFGIAEERTKAEFKTLDEEARRLEAEAHKHAAERDAVAATVPDDALELFQRVAKFRGSAVAEASDGMCGACHLKLRLQMFADIRRNQELMQCPACNRILYYEPQVPLVSPEP